MGYHHPLAICTVGIVGFVGGWGDLGGADELSCFIGAGLGLVVGAVSHSFIAGCEWSADCDGTMLLFSVLFLSPFLSLPFPLLSVSHLLLSFHHSLKICKLIPCSHSTCSFHIIGFEVGSDGSEHGVNVVREYPWFLMAPFELHSMEFCIMLINAPICSDGVFYDSVDHGTLCLPAFYY